MKKYVPYIIIALLLVMLVLSLIYPRGKTVERRITDTLTVVVTDTFVDLQPHYVYQKTIDTMIVYVDSSGCVELPITQKAYSGEYYRLWVSGYRPNLDSISVFNKTVTNTVTNTVERTVYADRTEWYIKAGSMFIGGNPAPYIGTDVNFKNGISLGADIGFFDKKGYYGFNIGFRLK